MPATQGSAIDVWFCAAPIAAKLRPAQEVLDVLHYFKTFIFRKNRT